VQALSRRLALERTGLLGSVTALNTLEPNVGELEKLAHFGAWLAMSLRSLSGDLHRADA
jgi:hypothetical protein